MTSKYGWSSQSPSQNIAKNKILQSDRAWSGDSRMLSATENRTELVFRRQLLWCHGSANGRGSLWASKRAWNRVQPSVGSSALSGRFGHAATRTTSYGPISDRAGFQKTAVFPLRHRQRVRLAVGFGTGPKSRPYKPWFDRGGLFPTFLVASATGPRARPRAGLFPIGRTYEKRLLLPCGVAIACDRQRDGSTRRRITAMCHGFGP